jgi:hypothetical protein
MQLLFLARTPSHSVSFVLQSEVLFVNKLLLLLNELLHSKLLLLLLFLQFGRRVIPLYCPESDMEVHG